MSSMLCAIVKNEAPYLVEWVAYHRMIGFDLIAIYQNNSTDETAQVLDRMRRIGVINAHIPFPSVAASPQLLAYGDAVRCCPTDWLMFLDADEFLMLKPGRRVNDFIAAFAPDVGCIGVNWRVFGSSGEKVFSPRPVMERFRLAAKADAAVNRHVKSLFRPKLVDQVHMHAPTLSSGRSVLSNGAPLEMEPHGLSTVVDWSAAQVNHYFCKKSRGIPDQARARRRASRRRRPRKIRQVHEGRVRPPRPQRRARPQRRTLVARPRRGLRRPAPPAERRNPTASARARRCGRP